MKSWKLAAAAALVLALPLTAEAQLRGHNILGDVGLLSATQPTKGAYVGAMVPFYTASKVRLDIGDEAGGTGTATLWGIAPVGQFVTNAEVLGATYGFAITAQFVNNAPEFPRRDIDDGGFGVGDMYVVPLQLGWHWDWSDALFQYAFYAPTGSYEFGALDNRGLGMWTHEFALGLTYHIDSYWNVSTTAFYETHGKKKDTDIQVGDILTLEGGLGYQVPGASTMFGAVYYAQWKVSADKLGGLDGSVIGLEEHNIFGVGPELRLFHGDLRLRGYLEFNSKNAYEGLTLNATLLLPI